jgi:protease I
MANILMILAEEGYQDKEYGDPRAVFEREGHRVFTASTQQVAKGKWGGTTNVDVLLNEVNPEDYDVVVFVGGPGSHQYFEDPKAHEIAHAFFEANKLTTAICAGPSILAHAGLLQGKKATCYDSQIENLKSHGAIYTGADVERDGNLITANGPMSAEQFGERIVGALNH